MYTVTTDDQSQQQIDALSAHALVPFAEARAALEVAPWNGEPYHKHKLDSPMRALSFGPAGEGDMVYLILEDLRRVDILRPLAPTSLPPHVHHTGRRPD